MGKVDFLFLEEENLVVAHASGAMIDSVFKESVGRIFNSDKLADGYKGLVDTRMVSAVKAPSSNAMFEMSRSTDKNRKIAVVYSDELIFGLVRIYDAYNQQAEMELFKDLDEAVKWLDIPNSEQEAIAFCLECDKNTGS